MSAALTEPATSPTDFSTDLKPTRAETSRANGRHSRGPTSTAGKLRSRQNGCKDGLTGKGVVLPPAASAEVDRIEADFARQFRPVDEFECELVRQMALATWRLRELSIRIIRQDAEANAARFATWDEDQRLAAAELGRHVSDDPEATVASLRRSSAGCDWLIGRWDLLGNALFTTEEGGPDCTWTDTDLALALDLLGRPAGLRHLDTWVGRLLSLRERAQAGSDEAVTELKEIVAEEVADLERYREEVWEGVEKPQLLLWKAGLDLDLGPVGTRLRRYEAAADRLFRSASSRLERLRRERGEPIAYAATRQPTADHSVLSPPPSLPDPPTPPAADVPERLPAAEPTRMPRTPAPVPTGSPACPVPVAPKLSPLVDLDTPVLDFWVGGPPQSL